MHILRGLALAALRSLACQDTHTRTTSHLPLLGAIARVRPAHSGHSSVQCATALAGREVVVCRTAAKGAAIKERASVFVIGGRVRGGAQNSATPRRAGSAHSLSHNHIEAQTRTGVASTPGPPARASRCAGAAPGTASGQQGARASRRQADGGSRERPRDSGTRSRDNSTAPDWSSSPRAGRLRKRISRCRVQPGFKRTCPWSRSCR